MEKFENVKIETISFEELEELEELKGPEDVMHNIADETFDKIDQCQCIEMAQIISYMGRCSDRS